jgi:hypothetical protein
MKLRRLLAIVFVLALVVPLSATTVTLVPEAAHTSIAFGHVGDPTVGGCSFCGPTPVHINAGTPANNGNINFTIESSVWPTTPGLTMRVLVERSLDGGATWGFLLGNDPSDPNDHFTSNSTTKDGTGLIKFGTRWGGESMDLRGSFVVNQSFSWGISATF